jgi:hypothetical protein
MLGGKWPEHHRDADNSPLLRKGIMHSFTIVYIMHTYIYIYIYMDPDFQVPSVFGVEKVTQTTPEFTHHLQGCGGRGSGPSRAL